MDLDLDIRTRGRPAEPVQVEIVRQITSADLALLAEPRGAKPSALKKLRDAHHSIARLIAQAIPDVEISAVTGYSQSRISILKSDPAFSELVAFYQKNVREIADEVMADATVKLATVRNEIVEELHDRLQDEPEKIATETLLDALKITADRTGMGPASKSTNLHVHVDLADRIAAGRRRAAQLGVPPTPAEGTAPSAVQAESPPRVIEGEVIK